MRKHSRAAVLVGENALLLEGLKRILVEAEYRVVVAAASLDSTTTFCIPKADANVIIITVGGNSELLLSQIRRVKEQWPDAIVLLLADHKELSDEEIYAAARLGASAYCLRPTCEILIKSLELLMAGESASPDAKISLVFRDNGPLPPITAPISREIEPGAETASANAYSERLHRGSPRLSERERTILRCLIEGDSNKIIARKNDIAEATVKVHVKAILRKIRVNNRTQAAIWGISQSHGAGGDSESVTSAARAAMTPRRAPSVGSLLRS